VVSIVKEYPIRRHKISRVETSVETLRDGLTELHVWTPLGMVLVRSVTQPHQEWSFYQFMWQGYRYSWTEDRARTITGLAIKAHWFAKRVAGGA
jgi:hypothetical protein